MYNGSRKYLNTCRHFFMNGLCVSYKTFRNFNSIMIMSIKFETNLRIIYICIPCFFFCNAESSSAVKTVNIIFLSHLGNFLKCFLCIKGFAVKKKCKHEPRLLFVESEDGSINFSNRKTRDIKFLKRRVLVQHCAKTVRII